MGKDQSTEAEVTTAIYRLEKEKKRHGIFLLILALVLALLTVAGIWMFDQWNKTDNDLQRSLGFSAAQDSRIGDLEDALDAQRKQFEACKDKPAGAPGCSQPVSPGSNQIPGPPGDQGVQGAQGIQGIQGAQGIPGHIGRTGLSCVQDLGLVACRGPVGPVGPAGADGLNGTNGTNGIDGKDGQNGQDGAPGQKGDKGDPGISTASFVCNATDTGITLVITLDDGTKFNVPLTFSNPVLGNITC